MSILTCDLCDADAGDDPYHATINGNGHTHICASCFDPQQHDVGVLREKLIDAIKDAERWRMTYVKLQECRESLLKSNKSLLEQIQVLEMRLAVCSKIISDRPDAGGEFMSQWIKCSDRLPDPGEIVLVCKTGGPAEFAMLYADKNRQDGYSWDVFLSGFGHKEDFRYFQYWLPLPPPPETQP